MQNKALYKILFVLTLLTLVLNADRLILGKNAALRKQDVADQYITKFQHCGSFWRDPSNNLWDSSILRGWPTYLGSVQPQHLGCFMSSVLPVHISFALMRIIVENLLLIGMFLFLFNFLGYRYSTALFGSLSYLAMYYWWSENPFVTQAAFLPLIVAAVSSGVKDIPRGLRFFLLLLSVFLSYPPYVVPLLPLCHFACIFFLSDKKRLSGDIKNFFFFWLMFAVFYFPNLMGYVLNWSQTNRVLWEVTGPVGFQFNALLSYFRHMGFLFPLFPLVFVLSPFKDKRALWLLLVIFVVLVFTSQTEVINAIPFVGILSFVYGRVYYFISFVLVLVITYLMEKSPAKISIKNVLFGAICTLGGAWLLYTSKSIKIALAFTLLSLLSISFVKWMILERAKSVGTFFILALIFVLPFKLVGLKHYEQVPYGFLYQDPFEYQSELKPFRAISLLNECVPHTVYSSQISIKGVEILDGTAVFYSKADAEYWTQYVLSELDECLFNTWNNRVALTDGIWFSNPDNILKWLRLNNTALIKSQYVLEREDLSLERTEKVPYSPIKSYITRESPTYRTYYLYRIKNPISRVFSINNDALKQNNGQLQDESILFESLNTLPIQNINLRKYRPGVFSWAGNFDNQSILSSTNYHKSWRLSVDGIEKKDSIQRGPFNMLMISPKRGSHEYVLRFNDDSHIYMIFCMLLGAGILLLVTKNINKTMSSL